MKILHRFIFCVSLLLCQNSMAGLTNPISEIIPEPTREFKHDLQNLAKKSGAEGDYFKLRLAENLLKQDNPDEAYKWVNRVKESTFEFWKTTILAEIHLAKTRLREVLALLKNLPDKPRYELSFGEGMYANLYKRAVVCRLLANRGLKHSTEADAAILVSLFPDDEVIEGLLGKNSNTIMLSDEQKVQRLHELHVRYQFKSVVGLLSPSDIKSTKLSKNEKCRALFELGDALRYSAGQGGPSLDAFTEVVAAKCDGDYIPRALYWIGSLNPGKDPTLGNQKKQALVRLYKNYPDHRLADDAVYKLYKTAEATKDFPQAKKYFKMLMELPKGDMKNDLVFSLAYPLYKKGHYKEALSKMQKAIDSEPTADETYPRILYWYGRIQEKLSSKNTAKAKITYQKLINTCPYSFYAILAANRLNKPIQHHPLPKLQGSPPPDSASWLVLIESFNQKDQHEAARTVLDFALHAHPEWENTHKEFVVKSLIDSQNYRKALDIAARHFDSGVYGPVTGSPDPIFAAFYPMAFRQKTKVGYSRNDLPFGAIEGIMREESLFQRTVKSRVGATGLMQLMPTTASMLRGKMPDVSFEYGLTDPEENIILGSTYLRDMKSYFKEQLPLAIMAYNAGPGNVNKWLRQFGNLELDEFIESIPFTETQGYVKRVMRSMQVYGYLYNETYFKNPDYFSFQIARNGK